MVSVDVRKTYEVCDGFAVNRSLRPVIAALALTLVVGTLSPLRAQWFGYPSTRAPRTASGTVDLSAAAPRLANGKPDLSGVWMTAEPACVSAALHLSPIFASSFPHR